MVLVKSIVNVRLPHGEEQDRDHLCEGGSPFFK